MQNGESVFGWLKVILVLVVLIVVSILLYEGWQGIKTVWSKLTSFASGAGNTIAEASKTVAAAPYKAVNATFVQPFVGYEGATLGTVIADGVDTVKNWFGVGPQQMVRGSVGNRPSGDLPDYGNGGF